MKVPFLVLLSLVGSAASDAIETKSVVAVDEPPADVNVEPGTSRAWALATSAVPFERNGDRHDLLAGVKLDEKSVVATKKLLEDDWDISTKVELMEQLEWLETEGHRFAFEKGFEKVSKLSEKDLEKELAKLSDEDQRKDMRALWTSAPRALKLKGGVLAWDLSRYVALCRWGYGAGLITEEEVWKRVEPVAKKLKKAYGSWEDLGEAYCIGRECWKPGTSEKTLAAFEKLKTAETSPWKSTPWDLKLGKLDRPEKPPEPKKKP